MCHASNTCVVFCVYYMYRTCVEHVYYIGITPVYRHIHYTCRYNTYVGYTPVLHCLKHLYYMCSTHTLQVYELCAIPVIHV